MQILANECGKDYRETVRRMWERIVTTEFGVTLTWEGRKRNSKKVVHQSKIFQLTKGIAYFVHAIYLNFLLVLFF